MAGGIIYWKERNRYRVWIPWNGKKFWINKYLDGTPLYSEGQAKRVLEKIRGEFDQKSFDPAHWGKDKSVIFERAWQIYMEQNKVGKARMEQRQMIYDNYLDPYFRGKSIRDILTIHVQDWWTEILKKSLSQNYQRLIGVTFKAFFHFHSDSLIRMPKFPVFHSQSKEIVWLDSDQQMQIHEFIPPQHRGIFQFLMVTGCRPQEVCNLRKVDLDWTKRIFSFKGTKTRRITPLPITPTIEGIVKNKGVVESLEYVFCTIRGLKYRRQTLYGIWTRANEKAHEKYGVPIVSNYMGNRHSWACRKADEGHPIKLISMGMGHSSVKTTEQYYLRYKTEQLIPLLSGVQGK